MFKKTITYTDFFGDKRTEDFYFNMNKAEVVEWQYSINGGINRLFEKIVNDGDQTLLVNTIKDLIRRSYGERSIDGKRFEKKRNGQYLFDDFEQTMAYEALFMELIQDEKAAADFINGLMPPDLVAQMAAKNGGNNAITAAR
jgi:hypothetical protein